MMLEREAVDALAREILVLIQRLRPLLEGPPNTWPASRGRAAASLSRDLARGGDCRLRSRRLGRGMDRGGRAGSGRAVRLALTAAVVRHADRSVYRVQWSVRDISRRPGPD